MRYLILEDSSERIKKFKSKLIGHEVMFTDVPKIAISLLKTSKWDFLCLDHDLDGKEMVDSGDGTGYEVAKFLYLNPEFKPDNIILHSYNPIGRKNMLNLLPEAIEAPGCWL